MYLLKLNNKQEIIITAKTIPIAMGFEPGCGPKKGISNKKVIAIIPINIKEKQQSRRVLVILIHLKN